MNNATNATQDTALVERSQMRSALAVATAAKDFDALRDVASMATALQQGAKARGMGVEQENAAAEVILRAEREIGRGLLDQRAAGLIQPRGGQRSQTVENLPSVKDLLPGVHQQYVAWWQKLADMPDDEFEGLLAYAVTKQERIAKVDFYRVAAAKGSSAGTPTREKNEAIEDSGFVALRLGIYRLLGWQVDEDGKGAPTRNGLTQLPADQLAEVKTLVESLAAAYGEAVRARRTIA